ncbi:hypothetical protein HPB49_003941 [Dermacentor silvarum]|uniref:Uncharacterized protein n=1 Tax=Dermacentor silvarum TaxID=543639 RepID=A0ACB8DTQ2_DERSI|nr:hypothetical protein HPB49_003941 [Dermacentor silvarum]
MFGAALVCVALAFGFSCSIILGAIGSTASVELTLLLASALDAGKFFVRGSMVDCGLPVPFTECLLGFCLCLYSAPRCAAHVNSTRNYASGLVSRALSLSPSVPACTRATSDSSPLSTCPRCTTSLTASCFRHPDPGRTPTKWLMMNDSIRILSNAETASISLDFVKNGQTPYLRRGKRPLLYPDFMEKGSHKTTHRPLGVLYRTCRSLEAAVGRLGHRHVNSGRCRALTLPGWEDYRESAFQALEEFDKLNMEDLVEKMTKFLTETTRNIFYNEASDANNSEPDICEDPGVGTLVVSFLRWCLEQHQPPREIFRVDTCAGGGYKCPQVTDGSVAGLQFVAGVTGPVPHLSGL